MSLKEFLNQGSGFSSTSTEQGTQQKREEQVTDLEAKFLEFLKEEQITKEELASRIQKMYTRGEHREICLVIKAGLEHLFCYGR